MALPSNVFFRPTVPGFVGLLLFFMYFFFGGGWASSAALECH